MATAGRMVSGSMHTPATTTREPIGAVVMMDSMTPGTPTHSKMTGRLGRVTPTVSRRRRVASQGTGSWRSFFMPARPARAPAVIEVAYPRPDRAANGEPSPGSTTVSAPQVLASARRRGEKSLATTVETPAALGMHMTASPTGPHPMTTAASFLGAPGVSVGLLAVPREGPLVG